MPDNKDHAIREERVYTIQCARNIAEDCVGRAEIASHGKDDGRPRSLGAAEKFFRGKGWTVHTNGYATCGSCMAMWAIPEPEPQGVPVPERQQQQQQERA